MLQSLNGQSSLLTLRFNAMLIESEEVDLLKKLFGNPKCTIQNLEMEELEVNEKRSKGLVEAIL